jgi:serine/threonine-protein phosphatase 4 regulatory subunit 1
MFLSRGEETVRETNSLPSIEASSSSSTPTSGSLRSLFERKTDNYARLTAAQEIDQKDLICAYNFPAVILTLGSQCWHGRLRDYYLKLWACTSYKVQHTLTASLAEVAEIIGPENTKQDILPCWKASLRSDDSQIRQMSVRHFRQLYRLLSPFDRDEIFTSLLLAWEGGLTGWRERLTVAELLPVLCERPEDEFIRLFGRVLRDPVAAVRLKAVELVGDTSCSLR